MIKLAEITRPFQLLGQQCRILEGFTLQIYAEDGFKSQIGQLQSQSVFLSICRTFQVSINDQRGNNPVFGGLMSQLGSMIQATCDPDGMEARASCSVDSLLIPVF